MLILRKKNFSVEITGPSKIFLYPGFKPETSWIAVVNQPLHHWVVQLHMLKQDIVAFSKYLTIITSIIG
jgi:hypothetical protein